MTAPIRIEVKVLVATFLLGGMFTLPASASSGDPMSRDVEFRESLARQDGPRELGVSTSVSRYLARRNGASKAGGPPK